MILIKDRHSPLTLLGYRELVHGKYDTYKGSTHNVLDELNSC